MRKKSFGTSAASFGVNISSFGMNPKICSEWSRFLHHKCCSVTIMSFLRRAVRTIYFIVNPKIRYGRHKKLPQRIVVLLNDELGGYCDKGLWYL